MLCQQNIAIIGVDDFYPKVNEEQNVNDQASKPRLLIGGLCQCIKPCVQAEGGHFEHLP